MQRYGTARQGALGFGKYRAPPSGRLLFVRIGVKSVGVGTLVLGFVAFTGLGCGSTANSGEPAAGDGGPETDGGDGTTGDGTTGDGTDTGGAGGSAGSGGATTGTATGTGGGGGTIGDPCIVGVPVTSQVRRLRNSEYDTILYDLLGVSSLPMDGGPPSSRLVSDFEGDITAIAWQSYQDVADVVADQVMAGDNRSRFISCDPTADAACYEQTIVSFGRKAFRRPLTTEEVTRFLSLAEADSSWTPDQVATAILYAFLVSPSFITVPELSMVPEGLGFKLSSYEVATRLSLMLWGSVPDAELETAADQDLLVTSDQIRAQAERMIVQREKAGPQVSAAHRYYVGMNSGASHWWRVTHDPELFPNYSDASQAALEGEMSAFFEEVAYEGGSFDDLFLSGVAFVNQDTAAIYGLDAAEFGAELSRVELDPSERPGAFTRAGFLSSYSSYDATNPILRGALLSTAVLGLEVGAPPVDVMPPPIAGDYTTRREQVEDVTETAAACAACHQLINAPGYVLEGFDAVGSEQTVDPLGGPIDRAATVTFADGSVRTISTPLELMQAIAQDPMAHHLYAEKLVSYFTGRPPNPSDICIVESVATKLAVEDYTVLDLVVDLTQAESFRLRFAGQ